MQSDVPPLPISYLTDKIRFRRNSNLKSSLTAEENSNNSLCKSNHSALNKFSLKKKKLYPLIVEDSPYRNSARFHPPDTAKSSNKSVIRERVSSTKMLRIKQLQNQLADAHFNLNELSNENKLLKAIQKRQDTALKRYEGTNAELPRIIHSHHEDLRVLQTKFKKLKSQYKVTSDVLKEKENELHSLQVQNKKLLQLSKDRQLGERQKLQTQVLDLNHRINEQDEIIQSMKRKLTLESKYLKHQLHTEMVKHKETQKQLQDTQFKLKSLEELMEQKEKRNYHTSRIAFFNKDRSTTTSQSLITLNESRSENLIKGHSFRRRQSDAATGQSLPVLNGLVLLSKNQSQENQKLNEDSSSTMTETRMNFEQIRHFHLHKSSNLHKPATFYTSRSSIRNSPIKESQLEEIDIKNNQMESDVNSENIRKIYELPKALKEEFYYPCHDNRNNEDASNSNEASEFLNLTNESRLLHARLVSSANNGVRPSKIQIGNRSLSLSKENIKNIIVNDKESKYDHDSVITVISKDVLKEDADTTTIYSNSNLESEMEIPIEFNIDEDKNIIRKSDIVTENLEIEKQTNTSSHLSKLFNQFYQTFDDSFDSNQDNNKIKLNLNTNSDKAELKSIDTSLIYSELFTNDDKPINNFLTQKEFIPIENIETFWDGNIFKKNYVKINENNSELDQIINSNEKTNSKNNEKKLFSDIEEDSKVTDKNLQISNSNDKISHNNIESDLKNVAKQETIENFKVFDKAKLLAAMKAIDDNENIEFIDQKVRRNSVIIQKSENLYRVGIPTHSRKKSDIMKELFTDTKLDNNKNST